MLSYSVRLGEDNLKRDNIVWSEKYVAPDLSFVSGVTSQNYHIDKDEYLAASIGSDTNFSRLKLEAHNVTRNGYIVVKGKNYRIQTAKTTTTSPTEVSYIEVNGVYYYVSGGKVTVKNHLKEQWKTVGGKTTVDVIEGDVEGTKSGDVIKLDTIYWIEDDTVEIDGYKYIYDKYDKSDSGKLKFYAGGRSLEPSEVTPCDSIAYNYFSNVSDYKYVTKFTLRKTEDKVTEFDNITYCTYFYYVLYKEYYCPVSKSGSGYICEIPKRLIDGSDTQEYSSTTVSSIYDLPSRISQLKTVKPYVTINGTEFQVEYLIQNSNGGDEIAIYMTDSTHNFSVGDKITLLYYVDGGNTTFPVYSINGSEFVMYDNAKYPLEKNIVDTVKIDGVEYDISYPNGKVVGKDALVEIDGENIPMKIKDASHLERYGLIVTGNTQAGTQTYEIKAYDGVIINDTAYRVMVYDTNPRTKYIITSIPMTTEFIIDSIEGSSMYICIPNLNTYEYDDSFRDEMCSQLCDLYVTRKNDVKIYSKNRAFGTRDITPTIGKTMDSSATSSNDYYSLFDNLVLFANTGYIEFDIPLTMNVANNAMQEDVVERDFIDKEKKKAINPIVDMEKDVYEPALMVGKYNGSDTEFQQVSEIEVNLHFRTRNLDNWKVNDPNVNLEVSGEIKKDGNGKITADTTNDNWFCTDFYPYKQIIESDEPEKSGIIKGDIVRRASDLMGLLYFDNDDVFYQKDNIAKSFLRFSYYDSPDPNTQSLLCTSTVFMDEHAMYKKYIDNSRRNVNDYGIVQETQYQRDENGNMKFPKQFVESMSGKTINRISVETECLEGGHKRGRTKYNKDNIDIDVLESDSKRISSRFIITNKYATDTSSEGFYLYIFREYSENLRPKPIYMKVEFNHAGIGRTIPFIIPMKWKDGEDNEKLPDIRLTLDNTQNTHPTTGEKLPSHLELLKQGYPLSYIYAQTYIPLYAVYDFKNKKYVYVFDDRYVFGSDTADNRIVLNMFELKVADESTATNETRAQVRNNNIERANIDVNPSQFDPNI